MKRKFPNSHLTWVTNSPAHFLLQHNPLIDRILTTSQEDLLALSALEFDIGFCVDKSLVAAGVLKQTTVDLLYGFQVDATSGAIVPATPAAEELWSLGLSNSKKFFENQKPETQLTLEALELGPYQRDEYLLQLTDAERFEAERRRGLWARPEQTVVGINTGCSAILPYKKLTVEFHRNLIRRLQEHSGYQVVLLGGKEDSLRNQRIAHGLGVQQSSTISGLRDGMISVAACDIVASGDSLGMHLAIALKKWVVAWFGPTCSQEIDLYDRGVRVLTQASCSPCWKRLCTNNPMCFDMVSIDEILGAIDLGRKQMRDVKTALEFSEEFPLPCPTP